MEFRLLGPIEAVIDRQPVALGGSRLEIVLAMLLLHPNQAVSVTRLIDALWDDDPPTTAKTQVMITISALRRLIGKKTITTQPHGYQLSVPDEAVDLARFNRLAESGAAAATEGRFPDAVRSLRSALALWRGPAVEGVESDIIRAAATRLNERRMAVCQECLDLELQLGRHSSVVGELAELVVQHPLNERFRAQLMLALYRSGRQADALGTFRAGRDILRTELGLDPGEALCRLEGAILTRDTGLDLPGGNPQPQVGAAADDVPIPRQLPRTIADFVGREAELHKMSQMLSSEDLESCPDVPVIALTGRGGVGKTALAVRAAHILRTSYPDGQLFVGLRADMRPSAASLLEHLLRSAGVHPDAIPSDLESRAGLFRSWLAHRRVLVVIDSAEGTDQIQYLLPGTRGCAAIVTSCQRLVALEGAYQIDVGPLDGKSAHRLLGALLGPDRVTAEEEAVRELIRLCDGLPLALRVVAAKLASRPHWRISRMVRQLLDEERRLDELDLDGVSVRATLAVAYDSLTSDVKRLLRRLSLLGPDDFPPWVCAPLLGMDLDDAEDLLQALVRAHLVEARLTDVSAVRYQLHDLVRIYAVEHLANEDPTGDRLDSVRRVLGCWLYIATMAHRRIYGGDFGVLHGTAGLWALPADALDALLADPAQWFRTERSGLMTAIYKASQLGMDELCWDLAVTTATLFESGFYSDDWRETHTIALERVRAAGNRRGEAAVLYSLGTRELGADLATAKDHFTRSFGIFNVLADEQGRALALIGMAFVDRLDGRYDKALAEYEEAVTAFRVAGDLAGEGHALKNMAQIHADRLDFETAEYLLDTSLTICQKLGSVRPTAQTLFEIAELHLRRGRLAHAVEGFASVLRLTRETGDVIGQSYALVGLGNARRMLGDENGAESALVTALELTEGGNDRLVRARILMSLAELDNVRGRGNAALVRADDAVALLRELGFAKVWHARALELLGRVLTRAGHAVAAEHAWRSAIELTSEADPALSGQLEKHLDRLSAGT